MTEQAPSVPRRKPPAKPKVWPTVAASLAVFGVLFEFLAFQLSAGNDPALGAGSAEAPAPKQRKRIIETTVITRVVPPRSSAEAGAPEASQLAASSSGSAPPSPVPVAAPAPATAPAPAPTTSSS